MAQRAPRAARRSRDATIFASEVNAGLPERWALVQIDAEQQFTVRLVSTDNRVLRAAVDRDDPAATVKRLIDGWRGLVDERGEPFFFNPDNLEVLVQEQRFVQAILEGVVAKVRHTSDKVHRASARHTWEQRNG